MAREGADFSSRLRVLGSLEGMDETEETTKAIVFVSIYFPLVRFVWLVPPWWFEYEYVCAAVFGWMVGSPDAL